MANFIQDCITNKCKVDQIDEYVHNWHEGDSELSLVEYLGMTEEEYSYYIKNSNNLNEIIFNRKKQYRVALRIKTNAGMMDCKRALDACDYDLDKAAIRLAEYFRSGKILF